MQVTKLSTETQALIKAKADQFEAGMQERVEEQNSLFDILDAEAKAAPQQPKLDAQDLLAQIITADDGLPPAEKARHNMVDPEPIDVLNFCVEYMDECDQKIAALQEACDNIRRAFQESCNNFAHQIALLREQSHDKRNNNN